MRHALTKLYPWLGLSLAVCGCVSSIVIIPDDIGGRGLLVGQISADTVPGAEDLDPVINGHTHIGGARRGYLVLSLSPGVYSLD